MQLTLPPEIEAYVQRQVSSGKYHTPTELVLVALELLQKQDDIQEKSLSELQEEARVGWEAYQKGDSVDGPTAIAQIRANLRKRYDSSES